MSSPRPNSSTASSSSTVTMVEDSGRPELPSDTANPDQPTSTSLKTSKPTSSILATPLDTMPPPMSPVTATTSRTQPARQLTFGAALARTTSDSSQHAAASLRRMTTHETGAPDYDFLHTHEEHGEHSDEDHTHSHDSDHDEIHPIGSTGEDQPHAIPDLEKGAVVETRPAKGKKKQIELQDQTNLLPAKQVFLVFAGLCCALVCSLLDQTIVTTALPTLGRVFNAADISSWVGTAYLLTSTAFQPIYGRVSDIFGRKFTLLGSLAIFLIGSLACALAQTMIQLIVFRAIQGIGGGGILTLSMIIVADVVSLKERGKYQGFQGGIIALSNSVGPILGGVFTEKVTWRWCFYINLPLTCLAIIIIIFLLPLKRVKGSMMAKLRKVDYYGSIITLAWATLVLLALSWAGTKYPWDSAGVLAPLLIGLALLGVFLFVEAKLVPLPLIPLHIFRNKTVAANMATTFANGFSFYATMYYLPQYFQVVRGDSPIRSGILTLPLALVQTTFGFTSGYLVSKTGDYKWNLIVGFFLWTIGLGLMTSLTPSTSVATTAGFQVIVAVGAGQTFQTSLIAIQAAVDRKDTAAATGTRNFLRMLGGTIALAACSAIVNNVVTSRLSTLDSSLVTTILTDPTQITNLGLSDAQIALIRDAYAHGINGCFAVMCPMAGISLFITIFLVDRLPITRKDDEARKAEAKAWYEARQARHGKKSGRHADDEHGAASPIEEGNEHDQSQTNSKDETRLEKELENVEKAARGLEEAADG